MNYRNPIRNMISGYFLKRFSCGTLNIILTCTEREGKRIQIQRALFSNERIAIDEKKTVRGRQRPVITGKQRNQSQQQPLHIIYASDNNNNNNNNNDANKSNIPSLSDSLSNRNQLRKLALEKLKELNSFTDADTFPVEIKDENDSLRNEIEHPNYHNVSSMPFFTSLKLKDMKVEKVEKVEGPENHLNVILSNESENILPPEPESNSLNKSTNDVLGPIQIESVLQFLNDHGCTNSTYLNLVGKHDYLEWMVITESSSSHHRLSVAKAFHEHFNLSSNFSIPVENKKHRKRNSPYSIHSNTSHLNDWILLNGEYFYLHIMSPEAKETYQLECLWTKEWDEKQKLQIPYHQDPSSLSASSNHMNTFLMKLAQLSLAKRKRLIDNYKENE